MTVWGLIGVAATMALAAGTQQVSGFGFALMAMPLLTVLVGPRDAVVLEALAGLSGGAAMAWSLRDRVAWSPLRRLLAGAVVGLPLGALVLAHVPETPLRIAVAVTVVAMVVVLARGVRLADESPRTEVGAGFVSGAMGTSIGISGPPVVLVLQAAAMEQHRFRATTVTFFVLTNLAVIPLLLGTGVADVDRWPAAVVAVPAALLGNQVCAGFAQRVPPERFRSLVLVLLVVAAGAALATAL
ncbi:MAG TPA: sulfite exporter TauE/SafE family protein [Iamia sp.]